MTTLRARVSSAKLEQKSDKAISSIKSEQKSNKPNIVFNSQTGLFKKAPGSKEMDVTELLKAIEEFSPKNLTKAQKIEFAKSIKTIWEKDSKLVQQLASEVGNQVEQRKADAKTAKHDSGYGVTDFIKMVIGLLASAKFGPLFMAASAAAQSVGGLFVVDGQPSGGADLCSQVIANIGCKQGYIQNGTNDWAPPLPQFARIVSATDGIAPDPTSGYYLQLRDCVTTDGVVGPAVIDAYAANPIPSVASCSATSSVWHNYQVQAIVQGGITTESCLALQNKLQVDFTKCQDTTGALLKAGAIAGIVIGGVFALACCVGAAYYCATNSRNNSRSYEISPV